MRTTLIFALIAVMCTFMTCSESSAEDLTGKKTLIVYYSWGGNTRVTAGQVKEATGADIFEVKEVDTYPTDYHECTERAKKEIKANFMPEIKGMPDGIANYDVIILGSPCWWGTITPPLMTFLSKFDTAGKTIALFMTHGGSRLGHSISDIKKLAPKANVLEGLAISGSSVNRAQGDVTAWLRENGLIK